MQIDKKYNQLLLDIIEDNLYQVSLKMEAFKGGKMTAERKRLEDKQKQLEALQHAISTSQD